MNQPPKTKKKHRGSGRKWFAVTGLVFVFAAIAGGIFLYHSFFRQTNARLIETVPLDASFIFQVNDNDAFVKSVKPVSPYLNDLFALDAFAGLQFFVDKFAANRNEKSTRVIISGHAAGDKVSLLFSTKIDKGEFEALLKNLRIDPRNHVAFDQKKIYSYGTHYKKFQFIYHNNIFSVSEDIELLKRSVSQLKTTRNLLSDTKFSRIFQIVEKNTKQNWLILQHANYFENFESQVNADYRDAFLKLKNISSWSAYQIKFTESELSLAGYSLADDSSFYTMFEKQVPGDYFPSSIIPLNVTSYTMVRTPDYTAFADDFGRKANVRIASDFNILNPLATCTFSIQKDTAAYYYQIVKTDSQKTKIEALFPENYSLDSAVKYKQFYIYKSKLKQLNTLLFPSYTVPAEYFMENQGCYVFSGSVASLKQYINLMGASSSIEDNSLYNFSRANLPSGNVIEFFYNDHNADQLGRYLSEEGKKSRLLRALRLFSCSFSPPENGIVASNIYIKFIPVTLTN